ncbi:ABC transporter ATP-binding protein [Desertibaculum subflavum]|uniref:ABC transporter ATP-binding protein n=1 Tax=Desertibaculum subflavum TaxID=2268458 RepID=UPI000E661D62
MQDRVAVATPLGVRLRALTLSYGGAALIREVDLDLAPGRITCLLGPSGIGKSTLLKAIAGLLTPDAGRIEGDDGRPLAGRVAWMGQDAGLLPWSDALGNVTLGSRLRGEPPDRERAQALLRLVGLAEAAAMLPAKLSGGMRQRVALARTLYEDKPVVLMDEPFAALDALTRHRLQAEAARLLAGRAVLLVTHDPAEALRLGHAVVVMRGAPAEFSQQLTPPGDPPRDPTEPAMAALQRRLLAELGAEVTA